MAGGIFSESWYRIANQSVSLRSHVHLRRQMFRGETWYVVEDPFTNQFFRIRPEAREFLVRLRPDRTVEEVWKECLDRDPENAPGQDDVLRLLAQLYHANLLQYGLPEDSVKLFERYKKRREKEIRSTLLSIMFLRIPLWDPDAFLQRTLRWVGPLFGRAGALLWLAVVLLGAKVAADHAGTLLDQSQGVLAPSNLFLLYGALVFLKVLHEFGHAYACRRLGGEVHVMGVMLLIFTPIPYVDATSSWAFRSRWQRAFVGAAGMIVEIFIAALAVMVWAYTAPGTLNSLAYNMIFIASVSTLLFNLNPLLRFDGYYILSDVLDVPSLHLRSSRQLIHLCERYLFGVTRSISPARSRREAAWLTAFGILSGIYKIILFAVITFFVADQFLLAGMIMAVLCVVSLGIVPLGRLGHYLLHAPQLERTRLRAIGVACGLLLGTWALLQWVPFRHHFRAPGVVQASAFVEVACPSPGMLAEVVAPSGARVPAGLVLLQLTDPELDFQRSLAAAEWAEADARVRASLKSASADLEPLTAYRAAVQQRRDRLEERAAELQLRAPMDGLWIAPELDSFKGAWLSRGLTLGRLIGDEGFRFSAVISQTQASRLFEGQIRGTQVRLRGQAGRALHVKDLLILPADRAVLPSAALGWFSGGDIEVSLEDAQGRTAVEPFFQVIAKLEADDAARFFHGGSGVIRFSLPSEPLWPRWMRAFRQLLQKRYQL